MNAQEIQIQGGCKHKSRAPFLHKAALPKLQRLGHEFLCLFDGDGLETDAAPAISVFLDNIDVLVLVLPGIPYFTAAQLVEFFYGGF